MKKIITTALIGMSFGAIGGSVISKDTVDCKETNCDIRVLVQEQNFTDAIYYKPNEWSTKTAKELKAEKTERYNAWKTFVEEQSKKETNEIIP